MVRPTKKEILEWLRSNKQKINWKLYDEPHIIVEKEPDLYQCPKSDKCIMICYHKNPHQYEEKYCNGLQGECGVKCVHELIHDCTFFDEDFLID